MHRSEGCVARQFVTYGLASESRDGCTVQKDVGSTVHYTRLGVAQLRDARTARSGQLHGSSRSGRKYESCTG